jgi:DNA repair protein RecO (recombination protein O)
MLKKDKGLCIRTTDYSESSQILTFFTAQDGKLSLIAKGTKRAKSSFSGPIELCTAGDMVFSLKEGEKLGTLTEFNPTFLGIALRKKLFAINCGFLACELLNLWTKELDPHPAMFDETILFLQRLEEIADNKILPFLLLFQFSLLSEAGTKPLCESCANCKRKFADNWQQYYFSSSANGLVCRDCESAFMDKKKISSQCAKALNRPQEIFNCDGKAIVEIQNLLIEYQTHILERPLRMASMILKLIKLQRGE